MGIWSRITGKNEAMSGIRIKRNDNNEQGLYYDPKVNKDDIHSNSDLLNMGEINKFRLLKTERNEKFNSFDLMAQDSRVASILNMYADDCTQFNQSSQVIWAESSNPDIAAFANRIIDNLQLNKHAWTHIYSLCKYGDLYLELFYDGEDNQDLNKVIKYERKQGAALIDRIEMIRNPGSLFDLVKDGKTEFYVRVNSVNENYDTVSNKLMTNIYKYGASESDLVLPPDKFIHICINDAYTRFPNQYILQDVDDNKEYKYDVREGNSILANIFKTWSELNLLEDSVLLNRLSKSAIIRLIQIEVGNTDDDDVRKILTQLRDKISRSRYLDKTTGEYKNQVNPGPLENIIYHATHKGNGAITHSTIGGDVDVKALADIDYFLEKFAQGFPIPLAYVKFTNDDGGGLSAGTSLTKFDARYGRTLKRYQNAYINGITDLINVYAYKRGVKDYINNFSIKMVSPSAVEDNERDEKLKNHAEIIKSIMDIIGTNNEIYSTEATKELLTYLLASMLQDTGMTEILQKDNIMPETDEETEITEGEETNEAY